ncbi:hypothetical protein K1T71_008998 [Dendrolimus kikuchii]|uniref:Uncharacterized protein n=1 Tax=Dendrolimus kikuchii TaxID=765133 RepID=A0ACC1CWH5_9NEOP|nr:hypothetical protein K1T71_008998 [Dendrolimus kikuchii]
MEDNSSSDDDIQDSPTSPKSGGKKLKLNDGSSQDSFKETVCSKDENIDSGVSADKSESTSSDDRGTGSTGGPSNEVVDVAPSTSNIHAILLNIRRPKRARNYRKRKTPERGTDSNDSSRDSDDLSSPELPNENANSETESLDLERFLESDSSESNDSHSGSNSSSASQNYESGDTDSGDDSGWLRSSYEETNEDKDKVPPVLLKTRPKQNYLMLREIINREMGLTFPGGKVAKDDILFEQRFYGSLHAVYRMKKLHNLNKHKGCVNSINFHPEGSLLVSGSDDTNIVVWDWARRLDLQTIKTGHKSNVFQSKFLYLNAQSQLNIVTCARDGQVRLLQCPPSGGSTVSRRRLASHSRAAHKLHVCAEEPHLVISAGEDGLVIQCDVRAEHASRLFQVNEKSKVIPLFSVVGHPLDPKELLVAGRDKFVRVYDRRKSTKPVTMYCPGSFNDVPQSNTRQKLRMRMMHLTCAIYNYNGSEILGSYNDEDIYLFDAKNDVHDPESNKELKLGYTHRYSGHRNSATFKGVAFFGPRSEYIVSGSDCSNIYIWEKKSEAIVQWLPGDVTGVVNCIEAHPRCPVLATSGLDKDVKIWIPRSERDPTYEGLASVVRSNTYSKMPSPLFNDFLPSLFSAWRAENRELFPEPTGDDDEVPQYGGNIEFEGNVCTTF